MKAFRRSMVRTGTRALSALAISTALANPATAQEPLPAGTDSSCNYMRCALWLEGRWLLRGGHGEKVTRTGFFRTMRLREHVSGDSAVYYAGRFARASGRAAAFAAIGTAGVLAGLAIDKIREHKCGAPYPFGSCRERDVPAFIALGLVTGGYITYYVSIPYSIRAYRARARAIWWHNLQYAR